MERRIHSFVRIFKSLGDPVRLKILKTVTEEPICVSEIAKIVGITSPLASHHLKILEREHLVIRTKKGVKVSYLLNKDGFDKLVVDFYKFLGIEMEVKNIPQFLKTVKHIESFLTTKAKFK